MCLFAWMPLNVAPAMSQAWSVEHMCLGILLAAWEVGLINFHLMNEQTEAWQGRRDVCIMTQNPSMTDLDFAQSLPGSEYPCVWHSTGQKCSEFFRLGLFPESVRKLGRWWYHLPTSYLCPGGACTSPMTLGLLLPQMSLRIPSNTS